MSGHGEGLLELAGAAAIEAVALGAQRTHCANCGAAFGGPFCAHCGEERDTHRRSVYALLHDFFEDLLSFDSRILRTARALVVQPGELTAAFREGRVRRYVPPIRLYFFVTLLFFLTLSLTGISILRLEIVEQPVPSATRAEVVANIKKANDALKKAGRSAIQLELPGGDTNSRSGPAELPTLRTRFFVPENSPVPALSAQTQHILAQAKAQLDAAQAQMAAKGEKSTWGRWLIVRTQSAMVALARDPGAVNGPLTDWIPRALFLLLPLFALLLAAFYWRQRKDYYFVDHLIFSLNAHSFAFVVLTAVVLLAPFVSSAWMGWAALMAVCLYLLIAMKRFYRQGWLMTGFKFCCLLFLYTSFFLLPVLSLVVAVSVLEA